ncbi:MAG: sulfatase [Deltaproteobacteria bacterium]|nr:sulfatase [Deltaproteobacteria bacterium]
MNAGSSISNRRLQGFAIRLCALVLASAGIGCNAPERPRPNVLLITVDTLRADRLGAYGFERNTSPAIDRLASRGVVFERAIAGASFTSGSHASIMTSRYTREHTIGYMNGGTRLEGITTLAEIFNREGYQTAAFVGNIMLDRRIGLDRGFEVYDDELPQAEQNRGFAFERIAEQTTERALLWLKNRDGRPFFLWVHYQDPHGPYTPPPAFKGRFRPEFDPDEEPLPILDTVTGLNGIPSYQELDGIRQPSIYETRYAEEIAYADHWIGELISQLDAISSDAESVIAFTSDHGESLGEAGIYFSHGSTTTPDQAHVPLILRAPGLPQGRRIETVHHVDLMPTLLDLAGFEVPDDISGIALGPILRGESPPPNRMVYCDEGFDLSAYGPDGFVRVGDILAAWNSGEANGSPTMAPRWAAYRWAPGEDWQAVDGIDADSKDVIRSYFRHAIPMVEAREPSELRVERLRALGYAE